MTALEIGDYVLATKWGDGDPCDQFCVGFVSGFLNKSTLRYDIVDGDGNLFRGNGFRRAEKITAEEGEELLKIFPKIANQPGPSLWDHLNRIRANKEPTNGQLAQDALAFIEKNSSKGQVFHYSNELSYFLNEASPEYESLCALLRNAYLSGKLMSTLYFEK